MEMSIVRHRDEFCFLILKHNVIIQGMGTKVVFLKICSMENQFLI